MIQGRLGLVVSFQVSEFLKKLKTPLRPRGELGHEAAFDGLGETPFSLYKSASRGTVFRAAYRYDADEETLYLNRVWMDHDLYEREASMGIGVRDDPDGIEWRDRTGMIWGDR